MTIPHQLIMHVKASPIIMLQNFPTDFISGRKNTKIMGHNIANTINPNITKIVNSSIIPYFKFFNNLCLAAPKSINVFNLLMSKLKFCLYNLKYFPSSPGCLSTLHT